MARHVACIRKIKICKICLLENLEVRDVFGDLSGQYNSKMDLRKVGRAIWAGLYWPDIEFISKQYIESEFRISVNFLTRRALLRFLITFCSTTEFYRRVWLIVVTNIFVTSTNIRRVLSCREVKQPKTLPFSVKKI